VLAGSTAIETQQRAESKIDLAAAHQRYQGEKLMQTY